MSREMEFVNPEELVRPVGFAHGVLVSGTGPILFLAGHCGYGPDGKIEHPGDLVAQFERCLQNVGAVLRSAGMEFTDLASLTIYVLDRDDYTARRREMGTAWRRHLGKHYPAMALVEVKRLFDPFALIEIMGTAVKRG